MKSAQHLPVSSAHHLLRKQWLRDEVIENVPALRKLKDRKKKVAEIGDPLTSISDEDDSVEKPASTSPRLRSGRSKRPPWGSCSTQKGHQQRQRQVQWLEQFEQKRQSSLPHSGKEDSFSHHSHSLGAGVFDGGGSGSGASSRASSRPSSPSPPSLSTNLSSASSTSIGDTTRCSHSSTRCNDHALCTVNFHC